MYYSEKQFLVPLQLFWQDELKGVHPLLWLLLKPFESWFYNTYLNLI